MKSIDRPALNRQLQVVSKGIDTTSHARGVTLIEVLVVIGTMSLLFALILPAVFFARENARRMQCSQNIRQLTLACHNYHDVYGALPSPTLPSPTQTFITRLFPYIEQPNWTNEQLSLPLPDRIPLLLCPSDSIPGTSIRPFSYLVNGGPSLPDYTDDGLVPPRSGANDRGLSFADFTDGVTNTSAISEYVATRATSATQVTASPAKQYFWQVDPTGITIAIPDNEIFVTRCEGGTMRTLFPGATAAIGSWSHEAGTNFGRYHHAMQPNSPLCQFSGNPAFSPWVQYGARSAAQSLHQSGVNVGMLDGSVRFVSDSIDRTVWRATGTRSGSDGPSVVNQ